MVISFIGHLGEHLFETYDFDLRLCPMQDEGFYTCHTYLRVDIAKWGAIEYTHQIPCFIVYHTWGVAHYHGWKDHALRAPFF